MGLFDFFRKPKQVVARQEPQKPVVPESEQKYYQDNSYYTDVAFSGTPFEKRVVTFEERKQTAFPSRTGLYPAEILLLEYCSYGTYPGPKNGYPGFWWFSYGIRDVGTALKSLECRGYITFAKAKDSLNSLTIPQLKDLLTKKGLPASGKKADLVACVAEAFTEAELLSFGIETKYVLTELGRYELDENAYVPYMHKAHNKTTEDASFGMTFNVWSINRLLGTGDKSNWRAIVAEQEERLNQQTSNNYNAFMEQIKTIDPKSFKVLQNQDEQLEAIQAARKNYDESKDIALYIAFWENLWNNGGLLFNGSKWHFELADMYIASKRYDDALRFVKKLKKDKKEYAEKADSYIAKIEGLISKQASKKNK